MRQLQDLTLHVGLPKTGTTTLQREVFPEFRGYVCGTESSGRSGDLAQQMLRLYQVKGAHRDWSTDDWRSEVTDWWTQARETSEGPLLVSLEGLFRWFDPVTGMPWPLMGDGEERWSSRHGYHPLIDFVLALQTALGDCRIRIALTVRSQAAFMASHYAQISYRVLAPSQRDFQDKVRQVTRSVDPFFNWFDTARGLSNVVGPENLRIAVFEDGLDHVSRTIASFVDDSWRPVLTATTHNVRGGPDGWATTTDNRSRIRGLVRNAWPTGTLPRTRRGIAATTRPLLRLVGGSPRPARTSITMNEDLLTEVRDAYRESNISLGHLCGRDLRSLGY